MSSLNYSALFLDPIEYSRVLQINHQNSRIEISFDLGLTKTAVLLRDEQILFENEYKIPIPAQDLIREDDKRTILIFKNGFWQKWIYFDQVSNQFIKPVFVSPQKPPTVEISGIKMHVTENQDPMTDTMLKIKALGKLRGKIVDTCCGLGYTAIFLANLKSVSQVFCVEINRIMIAICRENPWSRELFNSPKINLVLGSTAEIIKIMPDNSFGGILHDPPRYALSPELYTEEIYSHFLSILLYRGRLYHYTGNPKKERRRSLAERTISRLKSVGFSRVSAAYQGVIAQKL
jgi:predicted methyltransferase